MKKIVMTGGGTAGHVTPNIALFDSLQKDGYEIHYIGSYEGIEKGLIEDKRSLTMVSVPASSAVIVPGKT